MTKKLVQPTALSIESGVSDSPRDLAWTHINIPCQSACPAGTDIPGYIEALSQGDYGLAHAINFRDNVFPGVLGRVCSRPCEEACRHGRSGLGDSVAICSLKRVSSDFISSGEHGFDVQPPTGKTVAIVGGGVAGLAAARDLAALGHRIVVFEKHERPGGMLVQGIPTFRLPRDVIDRDVERVLALGIEIHCGVSVGEDVLLEEIVASYDAVVLATGTLAGRALDIEGEELRGTEHGLEFLLSVNERQRRDLGKKSVVIGGGYTAMDCARTALRLGSQTTVYYRRGAENMVVLPGEVEELVREGGGIQYFKSPERIRGDDQVQAISFASTDMPLTDAERELIDVDADQVILAIGQSPDTSWMSEPFSQQLLNHDQSIRSSDGFRTEHENIFIAGDFSTGATTLIDAIAHARNAAREVNKFLSVDAHDQKNSISIGSRKFARDFDDRTFVRNNAMNIIPIVPVPVVDVSTRDLMNEVETGFDQSVAQEQAERCYLCHYKFEIDNQKCVLCDECMKIKPNDDCILPIVGFDEPTSASVLPSPVRLVTGENDSLYYNRLWIDQDKCTRCGQCESVCPVDAISIQKVSFIKV